MADNLYSRYASGDSNTEGPLRFVDIGSVYYAVSILAKADGTLVDAATSANQTTMIGHLDGVEGLLTTIDEDTGGIATSAASIDGKITACNTGAVVVSSSALPSGAATSAKQDTQTTHLATLAGAVSGTEVQVDVLTMPTVTIADGGGSITIDGSVSVTGSVAVTGTFWQSTQPVSLASVPSHDVTNAGTFAVQATQAGTWTVQPGNTANTTAWLVTGTGGTFPVTDSGGSITVDAPVGTPAFVRMSNGTAAVDTIPVGVTSFPVGMIDSFGHMVVGSVNNQVDIQFYRGDGSVADIVTETNANGGTAAATGGMATFACTTSANSQAKGVTTETTLYTAGAEMYALFTAAFTGTGSGTSYQRIGLYDANNGFFVGYEGDAFGVTVRKGGADVQTQKANFSEDTLVGGAGSGFTRDGVIEAVTLTNLNVYRVRFGWVGSAPIKFEILSPDGKWVTFHEIRQPNLAALPSIEDADLPVTCDVHGGNSGAALSILTNCWCAGTTAATGKLTASISDATYSGLSRAVLAGKNASGTYANVRLDSLDALNVNPEVGISLDAMNAATGFTAFDTDTANLATTTKHVLGTAALSFDKANTAANATIAGIGKTLTSVNLGEVSHHDTIQTSVYLSAITDVAYVFVRIGTNSSNYNEWRIADTELTAGSFQSLLFSVGAPNYTGITGNGWNPAAITYLAVGVSFDAETNTLAGIVFDEVSYHNGLHTSTSLTAQVSSSVSTPNVRLNGYTVSTPTGGGVESGSLRVTIASDSTGVLSVDDNGGSITVDNGGTFVVQVDGTSLTRLTDIETNTDSGAVVGNGAAATAQRVTIANDSTGILAGVTTVTTVTTCSTVTNLSQLGGQAIAMGTGTRSAGTQRVTIATDDVVPITDNSGSITVDMPAVTTGGASIFRSIDLDESEEEVKGSAGTLYGGIVLNLATGVRYLKLYNATAANVTVGTTTPVMTIPIPTQSATASGAGFTLPVPPCGVAFDTAITAAATTGVADADTGAPGANEVVVNFFYK